MKNLKIVLKKCFYIIEYIISLVWWISRLILAVLIGGTLFGTIWILYFISVPLEWIYNICKNQVDKLLDKK